MGTPRLGRCLCGAPATIRDTKAADGRIHFICQDLTDEGKAKHYGFVDRSEAVRVDVPKERPGVFDGLNVVETMKKP